MAYAKPKNIKPAPLTDEQIAEQRRRAFLQKRASLAEGFLYNLVQNPNTDLTDTDEVAETALRLADSTLKVVYNQELKLTEEE